MKRIPLTQGKYAIVDDADYEWLNRFRWYALKDHNTFYAVRNITKPNGKRTLISMHREILGLVPGDLRACDHCNHNGLYNQRDNLRICNKSQNKQNGKPHKNSSSIFKGVCWNKDSHKWTAQIRVDGKQKYLGCFDSEIEAAEAYDKAAKKYFGNFANLNL